MKRSPRETEQNLSNCKNQEDAITTQKESILQDIRNLKRKFSKLLEELVFYNIY